MHKKPINIKSKHSVQENKLIEKRRIRTSINLEHQWDIIKKTECIFLLEKNRSEITNKQTT